MIRAFIESLLGEFGRAVYFFYQENSLFINGFIILYGLCVFFAHRSFYAAYEEIKKELKIENDKVIGKEKLTTLIQNTEFQWDLLKTKYWFPCIAIPGKIALHCKTKATLQKIFSPNNLLILLTGKVQDKHDSNL
ncbi:MAG: hypothetical protein C4545_10715 [Anaerolineaceae bacterium]|jgi:hypothetical protein|nr:MAG: hypothetical protein C4545_10715 [Anaerolineaceae bacterium]